MEPGRSKNSLTESIHWFQATVAAPWAEVFFSRFGATDASLDF